MTMFNKNNPDSVEKTVNTLFKTAIVVWVLGALASLTLTVGAVWVVCHFVLKFW